MPLRLASSLAGMAAALAATPALALSCLAPSVTDAFARANAAEEVYTIVLGTLSGGLPPRPTDHSGPLPEDRVYDMRFVGHTLNRDGPAEEVDTTITVVEQCAASWCAQIPTGRQVLTFLRIDTGGAPQLTVGPCYGDFFVDPTAEQLNEVLSCFAAGCTES